MTYMRPKLMKESSYAFPLLSLLAILSIMMFLPQSDAHADEGVNVTNIALEETSILEVTNNSEDSISMLRIWMAKDNSFKSYKTEIGWSGEITPQGVIVFTSSDPIEPGKSVKFGVKTDRISSGINWKALDKNNEQIDTGKASPKKPIPILDNTKDEKQSKTDEKEGITSESTFRTIPDKPRVGSTIRITGDDFGDSQDFDFYINAQQIGSFQTDENGHFVTTMKIPDDQKAERVDFKVKDKEGKEKKISIRINEKITDIPDTDVKLTMNVIPSVMYRGDKIELAGTAQPGSAITSKITNPNGEIINIRTAEVDRTGNWKLEDPIHFPLDAPFGKYSAVISDGRDEILKRWSIESDKKIIIAPTNLKFEPGEIMTFNGTVLPNIPLEIILEDPLGKEIFSDIIQVDNTGMISFQYQTEQTSTEGTYTVIATQEKEKEFTYAGVGQLPKIPVNLEFDKLNYKTGETAIISLSGKASDVINLLIINPSDNPIGDTILITLQPDGTGTYDLSLEGFSSGVYSAVATIGSAQSTEIFAVGLQMGSGDIEINTTKLEYLPGDSILILGETSPNALLTVSLVDPDGNQIRERENFSDKLGKISVDSFRIPTDAKTGEWTVNVKSGSNFDTAKIEVLSTIEEGMQISVTEGEKVHGMGQTITIEVTGAKQTVAFKIVSEDGKVLEDSLTFQASAQGKISQPWIIPKDTEPGTYKIIAIDAFDSAEASFEIK